MDFLKRYGLDKNSHPDWFVAFMLLTREMNRKMQLKQM